MVSVQYVKIADIQPAPYNPRKISDKQISELQKSIKTIGFSVPIIINKNNNIIIAGHQRTRSAKALGYTEVPAFYVDNIVYGDEIKFNQLHNGVEEKTFGKIRMNADYPKETFLRIDWHDFDYGDLKLSMPVVSEICKIILKYGNVMSAVICQKKVVFAVEYVYACKMLQQPVNAFICDDSKFEAIKHFFCQNYGEYSYDGIERNTFVQGLAQMNRSAEELEDKKSNKSALYVNYVLPYLHKHPECESILDFGCGKAAYINSLKKKYIAYGLEFYNHNSVGINITKGNAMIDALIKRVKDSPKFDVVVCDSVLNSIDSIKAEQSVMGCLNLFAKDRVFVSGRTMTSIVSQRKMKKSGADATKNRLYFPDADGMSAIYRKGQWFFQKFHTEQQVRDLMKRSGFEIIRMTYGSINCTSFQCECRKVRELSLEEYIAAVDFEFNLPLPNKKSYNRNEEMKAALGLISYEPEHTAENHNE